MKIELRKIDEIKPYRGNPRKIPQSAINKVAASIEQYGWRQPIVIDTHDVIVVGHVRWLAAKQLALDQVPVHIATELTPEQVRAYRIADSWFRAPATQLHCHNASIVRQLTSESEPIS